MRKFELPNLISIWMVLLPILLLAAFLRFYQLDQTNLEVDEIVNAHIPQMINEYGYPTSRPESGSGMRPYLFHPPLIYEFFAQWFKWNGSGVNSARPVNAAASILVLAMIFAFMAKSRGYGTAIAATILIATDGWMVMINRMNFLENIQLLFIIPALWAYWRAAHDEKEESISRYVLAGVLLGAVVTLKYIGAYIAVGFALNYFIIRRHHKGHFAMALSAALVFGIYFALMYSRWGEIFVEQSVLTHLRRLIGVQPSRGMNFGLQTIVSVIFQRYWIYVSTVIAIVLGGLMVAYRWGSMLINRFDLNLLKPNSILLSLATVSLAIAAASGVKSPHYMALWLVPIYLFLVVEFSRWIKGNVLIVSGLVLLAAMAVNMFTWNARFIQNQSDAIRDAAAFMQQYLPEDAVVATEPYIGYLIPQEYIREYRTDINDAQMAQVFLDQNVTHIAYYLSSTVQVSDSKVLSALYSVCQPMAAFSGFKDQVYVCELDQAQSQPILQALANPAP